VRPIPGSRRQRFTVQVAFGLLAVALLAMLHLGTGSVGLSPTEVLAALVNRPAQPFQHVIVWDLRLPRTLIAITVGAMLGLAGALLQVVMRNPLAEPEMTGATSGAVLFAVLWLARTPGHLAEPGLGLPLAAILGGLAAGGLVLALSLQGARGPSRLILTGVVVSAVLRSASSMLLLVRQEALGSILLWLIGSLNGRVWIHWALLWPWALVTLPLGLACAGWANVLQLGDDVAASLGLRVGWARAALLITAVLLTASAVAIVGGIVFLGLIAPHIARRLVGIDARKLFPFSMIVGAGLMLAADTAAQAITHPLALPVGAVLALFGAPFFLVLIWQGVR
jgi:iron complex transport system permease protein